MIRVVTLDCRRGRRVRAEAQLLLGTRGGSKGDQLPATAEPPLRVGGGKDRRLPRPGEAVPWSPWSLDRLRPPGGAGGPAGSELSPAGLHRPVPGSHSGQLRLAMAIP